MGSNIVIKNADFSAISIKSKIWAVNDSAYESRATSESNPNAVPFVPINIDNYQGKTIKRVRLKPASVGIITIVKGVLGSAMQDAATLTIGEGQINTWVEFNLNIPVGENEVIGVGKSTDTGTFYYYGPSYTGKNNFLVRGNLSTYSNPYDGARLCVSFMVESNEPLWLIDERYMESYASNNSTTYNTSFVAYNRGYRGRTITKIRLIPATAGKFTIRKGTSLTDANAVDVAELNFTAGMVGVATEFDVNIPVGENEVIGVGKSTDTGTIKYFSQSYQSGFNIGCFGYLETPSGSSSNLLVSIKGY